MRDIYRIVVHCTANHSQKYPFIKGAAAPYEAYKGMASYWFRKKKWLHPGYHFVVFPDGFIMQTAPIDKQTNGAIGYNKTAIHVAYYGGIGDSDFTDKQYYALCELVHMLHVFYRAPIFGHNELPDVQKNCPNLDMSQFRDACLNCPTSPLIHVHTDFYSNTSALDYEYHQSNN